MLIFALQLGFQGLSRPCFMPISFITISKGKVHLISWPHVQSSYLLYTDLFSDFIFSAGRIMQSLNYRLEIVLSIKLFEADIFKQHFSRHSSRYLACGFAYACLNLDKRWDPITHYRIFSLLLSDLLLCCNVEGNSYTARMISRTCGQLFTRQI